MEQVKDVWSLISPVVIIAVALFITWSLNFFIKDTE